MAKPINKDREDPMGDYLGAGGGAGQAPNTVPFDNLAPKLRDSGESFSIPGTGGGGGDGDLTGQLATLNDKMDKILAQAEIIASDGVIWRFE